MGLAVAEALLRAGGQVAVTGRRAERLEAVVRAWPGQAVALPCDLASPSERAGLLARARDALGGLDGLVHSAGVVEHQLPGHISEDALRAQLEINLVAPLRLGEEALSVLEDGGGMVFIASTLALRPLPTSAVYSAAKAGLLAAMRSLAIAGAARRIRANAVCPGVVDTEMVRAPRLSPGETPPDGRGARAEDLRPVVHAGGAASAGTAREGRGSGRRGGAPAVGAVDDRQRAGHRRRPAAARSEAQSFSPR